MVKNRKEFTNILDDCLDRILVKGESIEQCLQSYPAFARELGPLLKTALFAHKASAVAPRPEFRERARFQFQAALRDMATKKEKRGFFSFSALPRFATVAVSIILALVIAGSGTVAAAGNSLPDSPLYPVKLATETVQLKLAGTPLEKAEVYAKLADKRVTELVKMAEKGKPEQVQKVAQRLNGHLMAMAMEAKANGEVAAMMAGEQVPMMQSPVAAPVPMPRMAAPPSPASTPEPAPDAAAAVAPAVTESAPTPTAPPTPAPVMPPKPAPAPTPKLVPAPMPRPAPGPMPKPVPAPDVTAKKAPAPTKEKAPVAIAPTPPTVTPQPDPNMLAWMQKRAQLKMMVSEKASVNSDAIRKALKNAPESVKPALYQALTVADSGYQQALQSLEK
jgi:hypothetical protein